MPTADAEVTADCGLQIDGERIHLAIPAHLEPGEEATYCLRWTTTEALEIDALVGTLGPTGHHSLVLVHETPSAADGLAPCDEAELMDSRSSGRFSMLGGVSYETDGERLEFPSAPVQVGLRVPPGAQLVFDVHYLNASDVAVDACASIDLERGDVVLPVEFRAVLPEEQYDLSIASGETITETYEEPVGERIRVVAAASHMHEGGVHFRLSQVEGDRTLYESSTWSDPVPRFFSDSTTILEASDQLAVTCTFRNDTDHAQRFPEQMCVGALYYLSCQTPGLCPAGEGQ